MQCDKMIQKGVDYRTAGAYTKALETFLYIQKKWGNRPGLLTAIGVTYRLMGDYEKSYNYIIDDLKYFPNTKWVNFELGLTCRVSGKIRESLECFKKEYDLFPENIIALEEILIESHSDNLNFDTYRFLRQDDINQHIDSLKSFTTVNRTFVQGILSRTDSFEAPVSVQIGISNVCCDRCIFCSYQSKVITEKTGKQCYQPFNDPLIGEFLSVEHVDIDPGELSKLKKTKFMDFNAFSNLIDELSLLGVKEIAFIGIGESLVHPDFMNFLKLAKSKNFFCSLYSNGSLLNKETVDLLIEYKLDYLNISLDASTDYIHSIMHNSRSSLLDIAGNLKYLTASKNQLNLYAPAINLSFVVTNKNLCDVGSFVDLARDIGASSLYFSPLVTTFKTKHLQLDEKQFKLFTETYNRLLIENEKTHISIYSSFDLVKEMVHRKMGCYIGWKFSRIFPDGTVTYCCGCSNSMGNVFEHSFKEIWNNHKYKHMRQKKFYIEDNLLNSKSCFCLQCPHISSMIEMHQGIVKSMFYEYVAQKDPSLTDAVTAEFSNPDKEIDQYYSEESKYITFKNKKFYDIKFINNLTV